MPRALPGSGAPLLSKVSMDPALRGRFEFSIWKKHSPCTQVCCLYPVQDRTPRCHNRTVTHLWNLSSSRAGLELRSALSPPEHVAPHLTRRPLGGSELPVTERSGVGRLRGRRISGDPHSFSRASRFLMQRCKDTCHLPDVHCAPIRCCGHRSPAHLPSPGGSGWGVRS